MRNLFYLSVFAVLIFTSATLGCLHYASAATLTNVFVMPSDGIFLQKSYYTIAFTPATTSTLTSVNMTFPTGFVLSSAKLLENQNIPDGSISISGQSLLYTVITPASLPSGKSIQITLADITNPSTPSNRVNVTTYNGGIIVDGLTKSAAFSLNPVTNGMLGANSVSTSRIADGQVTSNDLANGAVTNPRIAKNSINSTQIIDGTIFDSDISPAAAIMLTKLAVGLLPPGIMINSANIEDGSIVNADLSNLAAIDLSKLATGALPSGITINSANIVNGSITAADIASNSIVDSRFGINTNMAFAGQGRDCTIGEIILTAGKTANGIPANGQILPINQNTALFSLLGSTYGGNGVTNFALPDLRGVAPNGLTYSICTVGIFPSRN